MKAFKFNKDGDYFRKLPKEVQDKLLKKEFLTFDELCEDFEFSGFYSDQLYELYAFGQVKDFTIVEIPDRPAVATFSVTVDRLKELLK